MTEIKSDKIKFSIGQPVMYRRYGVCTVITTETQKFGDTEKLYYSLEPVFGKKTKFFVPADMAELNNIVRKTCSKKELLDAIKSADKRKEGWQSDGRIRSEQFAEVLNNGNLEDMIWLVKILIIHREEQKAAGKTFLDVDKRVLAFAERLVTDEFAYVLGIDKTEVIDFIRKQTEETA